MSCHSSDWSIFKWIRKVGGIERPYALGMGEWDEWHILNKAQHPIAYWLTERVPDGIDWVHKVTIDKVHSARYYLVNRFVFRTHLLQTNLEKGEYHSVSKQIMHGSFEALVDFVEIECARHHLMWSSEDMTRYNFPWWAKMSITRWASWRSPESGVAYLHWCMGLDDPESNAEDRHPPQAESARVTFKLYYWWKYIHSARGEPFDESKLSLFYERMTEKYGSNSWMFPSSSGKNKLESTDQDEYDKIVALQDKMEKERVDEDEEMINLLISHREKLWT